MIRMFIAIAAVLFSLQVNADELDAICFSGDQSDESIESCSEGEIKRPERQTAQEHQAFVDIVQLAKDSPDLAGSILAVRVNLEWAIVDRSAEKKGPAGPSSSTLDKLIGLAGRQSVSGKATIRWTKITYDKDGNKTSFESFEINAGAAMGPGAAAAQASMDEAMNKNHM